MQKQRDVDFEVEDHAKQRVRAAIRSKGLNIKQFARESGMAYPSLRDYYSGLRKPGFDALALLIEFTGVSAEWLILGEGRMFPEQLVPMNNVNEELIGTIALMVSAEINGVDIVQDELEDQEITVEQYSANKSERQRKLNKARELGLITANVYNRVSLLETEDSRQISMRKEIKSLVGLYRNMNKEVKEDL